MNVREVARAYDLTTPRPCYEWRCLLNTMFMKNEITTKILSYKLVITNLREFVDIKLLENKKTLNKSIKK